MTCRHCKSQSGQFFLDLGFAPPSNAYLKAEFLTRSETYFPLRIWVCHECWLVQTEDYTSSNEIFDDEYAYFSSTSLSWLSHSSKYSDMIIEKLNLNSKSYVVEIASNDGYLLKNFVNRSIPCIGIEPTFSTASQSIKLGIETIQKFFNSDLASELAENKKADLIIGNNVYAHVPDVNDFTLGMRFLLNEGGTITLEFPHLLRLVKNIQFDTVYHEHFSYFSLFVVQKIFASCGLLVYDVEELETHGGSLRVYGCHVKENRKINDRVRKIISEELMFGLNSINRYSDFQNKVDVIKNDFVHFLISQKRKGKKIVGYGAAAKGNTLMNYAGIKKDLVPVIFDSAYSKQGKYLPGSHIPIMKPDEKVLSEADYVLILPWNIQNEVKEFINSFCSTPPKLFVAIPELIILD